VVLALLGAAAFAQTPSSVAVINYSGFVGSFPLAAGSIASAYGDFGNITTTAAATLNPMPKELAAVRLRVNNVEAPLYFVSRNQINFVVPWAVTVGRQTVEILAGGALVARGSMNTFDVGPGLASSDTSAARQGIIQNQDFSINGPSARAKRGEIIQIYATGCGAVSPALQDGVPPSGLSRAVARVKVYVSVEEVEPQFAGAHPLFPGICQVNAAIPDRPFITGQVPVFITVNGVASNPVSVWAE
jgi:uncharacterized protein (TIGR03437 family)